MAFSVKNTNLLPEILPKNTSEPSSFARVSSTIALQIFSMIENRKKIFVLSANV